MTHFSRAMVVMLARIESPRGGRLDFFHATEHLAAAIAAIHGDGTFATRHKFEFLRERLLTEDKGAEAVIDALAYLRRKHPRLTKVASVLAHFRKNRQRMQYAQWKRGIGMLVPSEASCFRGAGSL